MTRKQDNFFQRKWRYLTRVYARHKFIDNSRGLKKMCILLAGYKPYLYDIVFKRIEEFLDDDIDMCVVTSGLYSSEIEEICQKNKWSYLFTKINNIALIQNLAIHLHPNAEYIFKLDEDIFVTKDYFSILYDAYKIIEEDSDYVPGILAPIIPVNGYGYMRVLEKLGIREKYEHLFEKPRYASTPNWMIENNPEAAKFFWGSTGDIPHIDKLAEQFGREEFKCRPCPIQFSIGAILFSRELYNKMGYFTVNRFVTAKEMDETEICCTAIKLSRAIMVSENTVVGHIGFGRQAEGMKEFYQNNIDRFEIQ